MDIDEQRLRVERVVRELGRALDVDARTSRRRSTDGRRSRARLRRHVVPDRRARGDEAGLRRPEAVRLWQTIADTLGVGGIMRALRTIPVLLGVCADMEELCADAPLPYVPMSMLCWAVAEASSARAVGLCHSVQGTRATSRGISGFRR